MVSAGKLLDELGSSNESSNVEHAYRIDFLTFERMSSCSQMSLSLCFANSDKVTYKLFNLCSFLTNLRSIGSCFTDRINEVSCT